eukprot:606609-Rhodomonas_salina.1
MYRPEDVHHKSRQHLALRRQIAPTGHRVGRSHHTPGQYWTSHSRRVEADRGVPGVMRSGVRTSTGSTSGRPGSTVRHVSTGHRIA